MTFDLTSHAYMRLAAIRSEALTCTPTKDNDMTWNQNPAPPQTAYDEVMNRLGQAKEVSNRDPFIVAGAHDLIVAELGTFKDQKWGDSVRATFETETSSNPAAAPRTFTVKIWNLFKPSKFPTQATDADDFVNFVCALQGIKLGEHAQACRALIKSEREGGQLERQPARGARIKAFGQEVGKPNERGQRYVKVQWQTVPQDMAMIARTRAEIDQRRPLGAPAAAAPGQAAPQVNPYAQLPQGQGPYTAPPPAYTQQYAAPPPAMQAIPAGQLPPGVVPGGYGSYAPSPGGYSAMLPAPTQAPAPGKPPWNPAWGPMPASY